MDAFGPRRHELIDVEVTCDDALVGVDVHIAGVIPDPGDEHRRTVAAVVRDRQDAAVGVRIADHRLLFGKR